MTTLSGPYGCDINDAIAVVGAFNQAPIIRVLCKGIGITNLQVEKLSEQQLIGAVGRVSRESLLCRKPMPSLEQAPKFRALVLTAGPTEPACDLSRQCAAAPR